MKAETVIKVGMADLNVSFDRHPLRTTGLGSCVGVTLYDPSTKKAGMIHVMLPSSDIARDGAVNKAKYADTGIYELVRRMEEHGTTVRKLQAKMAGGAQMFAFAANGGDLMRIGPRNVESCKIWLDHLQIPLIAEDTGGNYGRTIEFDPETGILHIRSIQHGTKEL